MSSPSKESAKGPMPRLISQVSAIVEFEQRHFRLVIQEAVFGVIFVQGASSSTVEILHSRRIPQFHHSRTLGLAAVAVKAQRRRKRYRFQAVSLCHNHAIAIDYYAGKTNDSRLRFTRRDMIATEPKRATCSRIARNRKRSDRGGGRVAFPHAAGISAYL